jgi:hypothetical protein
MYRLFSDGSVDRRNVRSRGYRCRSEYDRTRYQRHRPPAPRVLDRQLGASAVFGGVVTTIGLLAGAPLIVGAGIAAMGTSLPAAHKYFEDKGSIELNDMYFLWRLQQRAMANLHGI